MRIVFIIKTIANGGLERRTVNLANHFSKNCKHDISLITSHIQEHEYELQPKVKRIELLTGDLLCDIFKISRFITDKKYDVIISMGIYANWLVCSVRMLIRFKVVIVEANDPKHDRLSFFSRILRKILYWRADGYIFQTQEEKEFYSRNIQKRSTVIHNPVKDSLPKRTQNVNKEIVTVGRLMPQKNHAMLLKAFYIVHKNHPQYILRIFGKGTEEFKLKEMVRELNLEGCVKIEGFCIDVHEKIKDSDIFVMTSDYEGMPNALMEAMAMGFPVISTDCGGGGPKELIRDNYNGLLVPIGDEIALAEKIEWLINNPRDKERIRLSAEEIKVSHSLVTICKLWETYLLNLGGIDNV